MENTVLKTVRLNRVNVAFIKSFNLVRFDKGQPLVNWSGNVNSMAALSEIMLNDLTPDLSQSERGIIKQAFNTKLNTKNINFQLNKEVNEFRQILERVSNDVKLINRLDKLTIAEKAAVIYEARKKA